MGDVFNSLIQTTTWEIVSLSPLVELQLSASGILHTKEIPMEVSTNSRPDYPPKEYNQQPRVDFKETFNPTVKAV